MLSARAYSFHQKSKLAISLSWIAGYVNVVLLLACGTLVSHVTGNATYFGSQLVHGPFTGALHFGFIVLSFWLGAVTSAFMTEGAKRRGVRSKYVLPMAVEGALLGFLAIGIAWLTRGRIELTAVNFHVLIGIGAFAMGLQNATITEISGVVRTTHVTGVVTDLGLEGVRLFNWWRDKTAKRRWSRTGRMLRISQRHPTALRVLLLASIFGSFVFGTVIGTLAHGRFPAQALLVPVLFIIWIILMDWRKPIADVREIDLLSDPELQLYGIVKSLLPAELGLYRLSHHRGDRAHRPPDFHLWAEHLPGHWRVIVLAASPLTYFDSNAALDLRDVVDQLHMQGRELVVSGITPAQYKAMERSGLTGILDVENFCPDLEFAIARGIELVRQLGEADTRATLARLAVDG
jgi:uncharacterized membrane protein YoaK (UPF0700 family)